MDGKLLALSVALAATNALAAYMLFRRNPSHNFLRRGPVFINCFLVLLFFALAQLPQAIPWIFERVLGHSVSDIYTHSPDAQGVRISGTWWVERWLDPLQTLFFSWCLAVGIAWALLNIVFRRSVKLNVVALLGGLVLFVWHEFAMMARAPL